MRAISVALFTLTLFAPPVFAQSLDIPEGGFAVSDDANLLPDAVRAKRAELLAIAKSGDISALAPILTADETNVSFGGPDDPAAYLVETSADGEGLEILALLANLLETPYAAVDGSEGDDGAAFYVWPSLAYYDTLSDLSAADRVTAYRIMGYQGFEEMKGLDAWYHWRVYIGPDGRLEAFVAGD